MSAYTYGHVALMHGFRLLAVLFAASLVLGGMAWLAGAIYAAHRRRTKRRHDERFDPLCRHTDDQGGAS